jgi:hypothetical protein
MCIVNICCIFAINEKYDTYYLKSGILQQLSFKLKIHVKNVLPEQRQVESDFTPYQILGVTDLEYSQFYEVRMADEGR